MKVEDSGSTDIIFAKFHFNDTEVVQVFSDRVICSCDDEHCEHLQYITPYLN